MKRLHPEGKMKGGIGDIFQKETKYCRGKLPGSYLRREGKPEPCKSYPSSQRVKLASPEEEGGMPLWQAIQRRRSIRDFRDVPLKKAALSRLLWASQGITKQIMGCELRAAPSAGALYPVETYLVIHSVEDVASGIYHYDVRTHELEELRRGDFHAPVAEAALDQDFITESNVVFIWTAIFARSKWKYIERAYRYVYLDAGHIAQNVALAAVALGLGSCQIAALYDDEVNALIGVDGEKESIVYMTAVGHPR